MGTTGFGQTVPNNGLSISPPHIELTSKRDYVQMIVTSSYGKTVHDVTHQAKWTCSDQKVIRAVNGKVTAVGNGSATISVQAEGRTTKATISVTGFSKPDPISFKFETVPVLTKQGCATGSCHGSPHGRGGFSLSLLGYDPTIDRNSLILDGFNRRTNTIDPDESLILKKPLLALPHVGGKRLLTGRTPCNILRGWIAEGANASLPDVDVKDIELSPGGEHTFHSPFVNQQLRVVAKLSDGTVKDVSSIATYESSHPNVAKVDADGYVTALSRGQAGISVRFLDKLKTVHFTVVEEVPGFKWVERPEVNFIDKLVNQKLKQLQFVTSTICTDSEFIRRTTLDITGSLPSPEAAQAFISSRDKYKRRSLIEHLLNSEAYARFWALKLADIMRVSQQKMPNGGAERFSDWLVDSIRRNQPYDAFVRELLTAKGKVNQVAPANYFVAIPTVEERTEITSQIFMGTRVECAKCHNHPFETWTMRDYYSIGAVFARTNINQGSLILTNEGESYHPTTHEKMSPWGTPKSINLDNTDRRIAFSNWLTQKDNPFFSRVEVNRIWNELFGKGIVDPVDDFRSSNPPANIELLDALAKEFVSSGYDRKHIVEIICNSQTYQRSAQASPLNTADDTLFSHCKVRMLSAEQLKDAIGTVTHQLPNLESSMETETSLIQKLEERRSNFKSRLGESQASLSTLLTLADHDSIQLNRKLFEVKNRMAFATQRPYPERNEFTIAFGQPKRDTACTCERQSAPTLVQALELLNGGAAYDLVLRGSVIYEPLDNSTLIDMLYMSAYSRHPNAAEQATAMKFLTSAKERKSAITDLIWTIINTREFVFQH